MPRRITLSLLAVTATALLAAGCGDDDKPDSAASATATQTTEAPAEASTPATEGAATIDEENLRAFVDAINEDPAILCDPENATTEVLEQLGGEEACAAAAATEEGGKEYTIDDVQIDGDTATVVITDEDETSTNLFVQQGDELKFAGQQ